MQYDVIVIGSGIGGLTSAAILAKEGKKVLVVEQSDKFGGFGQSMEKNGYVFDYAIHSIMDWGFIKKVLDDLGETLPFGLVSARRGDRIVFPEHTLLATNIENIVIQLTNFFPEEGDAIKRYFTDLVESMETLLKYNKSRDLSLANKLVIKYPDFWNKSLEEVINIYFKSEKLKSLIFGFHDGYCYDYAWHYSGHHQYKIKYLHEAHAIKNGSRHLVDAFVRAIIKFGGELRNNTLVKRILVRDERACGILLNDGNEIFANEAVISNADARLTYTRMLDKEILPPKMKESLEKWDSSGVSLSYYLVNVGLDIDVKEKYGMEYDLTVYFPSYDLPGVFKNINKGILPDDFWLWAVFPSVNDPTLAPAGHSTAILSTMVPYGIENDTGCNPGYFDGFRQIEEKGKKYLQKIEEIERRLIERAEEIFPDISKHIKFKETWTPQTFQDFTLNYKGSTMGFKVEPVTSKNKRYLSKSGMDIKSQISGLYQVGGWAEFGFSTIAVVQSARFAAYDILNIERPFSAVADINDRVIHLNKGVKDYK
jgi:phytoene dehydrogenase-like protein